MKFFSSTTFKYLQNYLSYQTKFVWLNIFNISYSDFIFTLSVTFQQVCTSTFLHEDLKRNIFDILCYSKSFSSIVQISMSDSAVIVVLL